MAALPNEIRLILRAQSGDREAYGRLIVLIERQLYAYLVGIVRQPALAEDVMQEVLFCAYQKLTWLREPSLFRPWLYRIASREAFRVVQRSRRHEQVELSEDTAAVDTQGVRDPMIVARLPELLDRLSPASRAVVLLHYYEEQSIEEIAAILGAPLGTIKSRLSYGLSVLREQLETDRAKGGSHE